MPPDLSLYTSSHRAELERLLASDVWQRALRSGLVDEVRATRREPPVTRGFTDTVVEQLVALNGERARQLITDGCRDQAMLFDALARWPADLGDHSLRLSFIGLNVTACCNIEPRCLYCNQPLLDEALSRDDWARIIDEVSAANGDKGAYIYVTGGEPLTLGPELWGDDGLIAYATARGNAVNVNTNGTLITPEVALRLVKAGTGRLHVSLDSAEPAVQNALYGGDWYARILEGIYNVQLARDLVGVTWPRMHTNCVLTRRNLDGIPDLYAFTLDKHARISDKGHPLFTDLLPHIIPVGGGVDDDEDAECEPLRPTADEFVRFYEQVWPRVVALWGDYQARVGVPEADRGDLPGYFVNPWLRVRHAGSLADYAAVSEQGRFATLALAAHCYVAPTQATFAPDGEQYRCGWHAIARHLPVGNVHQRGVLASIRDGLGGLGALPWEQYCDGCSLATLYINQQVEDRLLAQLREWLGQAPASTGAATPDPA